jgi:hypothetical protein
LLPTTGYADDLGGNASLSSTERGNAMWRFLVAVAREAGDGQREALGEGWSFDRTEAVSFDEPMSIVRGMIQAVYAVVEIDAGVGEWGAESDGDDAAPAWVAGLLAPVDLVAVAGSWVEVDGKPFAFVAAVEDSPAF